MEGSYARVGYTIDVCRGDEAWNSSQVWYLPFDDLNAEVTSDITWWPWREWYYTVNVCNFAISRCDEDNSQLSEKMKRIKGQVLFLRGLSYYNLVGYYQNPPLITDYATYSSLDGLYTGDSTYDAVLDQVESDFKEAMELLPSRDQGGEWEKGRATCGAAAGYYARALMVRHKFKDALTVLKDIIGKKYGTYELIDNYGDNFREGPAYENNKESLFEVQFLDLESQGTDDEWTPVNTSPNATQGSAIESNFAPGNYGGWADISASPWLYHLFKAERTTDGKLDPRLYWTIGTYESDWEDFEYGNVAYTSKLTATDNIVTNNTYGGLPIAKFTNLRTGLYSTVITGLHDGINLRLMCCSGLPNVKTKSTAPHNRPSTGLTKYATALTCPIWNWLTSLQPTNSSSRLPMWSVRKNLVVSSDADSILSAGDSSIRMIVCNNLRSTVSYAVL